MRSIALIIFLLCVYLAVGAQYTVTKVVGVVKNNRTGLALKPGSKLSDDDELRFSGPSDQVRVIVAGKGVYVIGPSAKAQKGENVIIEMLKTALHVKPKEGYLSGRGAEEQLLPAALETQAKLVFAEENAFRFDTTDFVTSNGSKFFLQIEGEGMAPVVKQLITREDTLFLMSKDFELPGRKPSGLNYSLGYFSKADKSSRPIIEIEPAFTTRKELRQLLSIIANGMKGMKKEAVREAAYAEVMETMGRPSMIMFDGIFRAVYTAN